MTAVGLVAGFVGAAWSMRLMQGVLFGIEPFDSISFALAALVLLPTAVFACLVPAARAAGTDPTQVLRRE